jgi:hypothetical protein
MNERTSVRQWIGFVLLALGACVLAVGVLALFAGVFFKSCGYAC